LVALLMDHIEQHLTLMEQLKMDNPDLLDIALGNPLGSTRQMMGAMAPAPGGQPGQETPAEMPSAEQAAAGGVEDIAQQGRDTANQRLAQVGGEPSGQA
jgi:hypothetical protein